MYVFTNLSDEKLDGLLAAVFAEKERRVLANIEQYPVPNLISSGNTVDNIIAYRNQCKLVNVNIDISVARTVVSYYRNKQNA